MMRPILFLCFGFILADSAIPLANAEENLATAVSTGSIWRKHYTMQPPKVSLASALNLNQKGGKNHPKIPLDEKSRTDYLLPKNALRITTAPPSHDWMMPKFDDSGWERTVGVDFTGQYAFVQGAPGSASEDIPFIRSTDSFMAEIGSIAMRTRFLVKAPAKVSKALLSLTCRGGFIAWLNGVEIGRASVPLGKLGPKTPADDYPLEAFFGLKNAAIVASAGSNESYLTKNKNRDADWLRRERHLQSMEIEPELLKKGVNILAIRLHRSDYLAKCKIRVSNGQYVPFATIGLSEISFQLACTQENVAGSTHRPAGFTIWNSEPWQPVHNTDFGVPHDSIHPVRILAARNGRFSGQIVIGATAPIENLKVFFKRAGLRKRIPSDWISVRYAIPNTTYEDGEFSWFNGLREIRYDGLVDTPPQKIVLTAGSTRDAWSAPVRETLGLPSKPLPAAVQPIWLSISVPNKARPGRYAGSLIIETDGGVARKVPVELEVSQWSLPDLADYQSNIFLYPSPDSLAIYYDEDLWSDAHWKLVEDTFRLMADMGNIGLVLNLIAEAQMGNSESVVRWISQPGGGYKYDFSVLDKFLNLAMKHHDLNRLKSVVLNCWGKNSTSRFTAAKTGAGVWVTELSPDTGETKKLILPAYGDPRTIKYLRPMLLSVTKRLKKYGLADKVRLGICADAPPPAADAAMLHSILPTATWAVISHHGHKRIYYHATDRTKYVPVGLQSLVYGNKFGAEWWKKEPSAMLLQFYRAGNGGRYMMDYPKPLDFYYWMEHAIICGRAGLGNVGADYFKLWPRENSVNKFVFGHRNADKGVEILFNSFPSSAIGYLGLDSTVSDLFAPGPNGPVVSVRSENAREGIQQTETRMFIRKALHAPQLPLPEALVMKAEQILERRKQLIARQELLPYVMFGDRVRKHTRELFDLAAEIQDFRLKAGK